ncbi:hypothetical protein AB835_14835 [Candidatus Endobugula sertula]|uniref:Uncharacterized protein n=1 Tax=Candidatus Endobugula sertula TaxID=62101 RepID=A0A1D2QL82_9GAMM|nr:hypothetical protein AB835_14835 [Candidatus Endobugula sertula]
MFSYQEILERGLIKQIYTRTLINFLKAAVYECCPLNIFNYIVHSEDFLTTANTLEKDLTSYAHKDPALDGNVELIIRTSLPFYAVMHYKACKYVRVQQEFRYK